MKNIKILMATPPYLYVASNAWVPLHTTKYIKVKTTANKSPFPIKVDKCPKDNGPYYNLGPVPYIYASNTRQIQYKNIQNGGINLLENELVAQFTLLNDEYTPSALKAINTNNEANNRKGFCNSKPIPVRKQCYTLTQRLLEKNH